MMGEVKVQGYKWVQDPIASPHLFYVSCPSHSWDMAMVKVG